MFGAVTHLPSLPSVSFTDDDLPTCVMIRMTSVVLRWLFP